MANPEQLSILEKGVLDWNRWRLSLRHKEMLESFIHLDLTRANLRSAVLAGIDFSGVDLTGADLTNAYLVGAQFGDTIQVFRPDPADEGEAHAVLAGAKLIKADLSGTILRATQFIGTDLQAANLRHASLFETVFANSTLVGAQGLDSCDHEGPSTIDIRTLQRSGMLPVAFLRGCGLPDEVIEFLPSLLNDPVQFFSCFISYSAHDQEFADRLYADLQNQGIRCWFAPEDLAIGDKFRKRIHESIRIYEKLLVILSRNSISSAWVEEEVGAALARERQEQREVLFPIRIDDAAMGTTEGWAEALRHSRHIGNFAGWRNYDLYSKGFQRLVRDLKRNSKDAVS